MNKVLLGLTSLLFAAFAFADIPCGYPSKQEQSLEFYKTCGQIKGDQFLLQDFHKNNIEFDNYGLACIMAGQQAFYINKKGETRRTVFFDNGCDYFKDGYARGYENGKMVYIDEQLHVKLKPDFEFLLPFDYDHAVVCNGPFEKIEDGEHSRMTKGQCGLIDNQGKLVVEAKYPIGDDDAFKHYINSHNHCPKPPITSKESAICHAERHLQHQSNFNEVTKIVSAIKNNNKWLVNFTYQDESESVFVIELESKTADWLSIVPVE